MYLELSHKVIKYPCTTLCGAHFQGTGNEPHEKVFQEQLSLELIMCTKFQCKLLKL